MKQLNAVPIYFTRFIVLPSLVCACWISVGLGQSMFPTGAYTNGQFTITFLADGTHSVATDGNVVVKGTYTVTPDQIVLTDKEGDYACDKPGKYKWKVEGTGLKFEIVEDDCGGRATALSAQVWAKK